MQLVENESLFADFIAYEFQKKLLSEIFFRKVYFAGEFSGSFLARLQNYNEQGYRLTVTIDYR